MWKVKEVIEFSDGYRVRASLLSKQSLEIVEIWMSVKKNNDGSMSLKPSDNWTIKNKDTQLLLINEIKDKLTEEKYEN